jgi:hypothetical protein
MVGGWEMLRDEDKRNMGWERDIWGIKTGIRKKVWVQFH